MTVLTLLAVLIVGQPDRLHDTVHIPGLPQSAPTAAVAPGVERQPQAAPPGDPTSSGSGVPPSPGPEDQLAGIGHIADAVGWCESRNLYHGRDGDIRGTEPRSTASGRYRFIRSTWAYVWRGYLGQEPPTLDAKDATPEQQDRAFVALFEAEGLTPWAASKSCWEGRL